MGSYFSLPDGGLKTYCRRKTLSPIVVDANNYGLMQLINHIAEHFMWGSKQYITLCRPCEDNGELFVGIKSDEQLLHWIQLNLDKGVVHIDAQINNFEGPLQFSPTKRALHPKVRERVKEKVFEPPCTPSLNLNALVDPTQLTQDTSTKKGATPTKESFTSTKRGNKSRRKAQDEEPVGVDEEGMYSDTDSLVALSDSSYDTDLAASSDSDIDSEYDPDDEIVDDIDREVPPFSYDVDDPYIAAGVVFPDVKQCKEAVTQHAILNDHAFRPIKTDKGRFRAVCLRQDKGCEWKFFASTSKKKYIGCKVKVNGPTLICGNGTTEVIVRTIRHAVNLREKTCSCRAWQVCGKPCSHALATIAKISSQINMEDFVHEYFSVERFKKAYEGTFKPMTSQEQWPHVHLGYKLKKPKLRRKPGRPRVSWIKASDELGSKKKRKCTECDQLGHTTKYCQGGPTASQRRRFSSSQNEHGEGSNEPIAEHTSNASGSGAATESGNASAIGNGRPPTVKGRGRGRSGTTGGRFGAWFGL